MQSSFELLALFPPFFCTLEAEVDSEMELSMGELSWVEVEEIMFFISTSLISVSANPVFSMNVNRYGIVYDISDTSANQIQSLFEKGKRPRIWQLCQEASGNLQGLKTYCSYFQKKREFSSFMSFCHTIVSVQPSYVWSHMCIIK